MKRELVVFSVIGGLLWAATGFSVLAVTFFDEGPRNSVFDQALVAEASSPVRLPADARSRDEVTSVPLCETTLSDTSQPRTVRDRDDQPAGARPDDDESGRCWHHKAISLLHFCFLLT